MKEETLNCCDKICYSSTKKSDYSIFIWHLSSIILKVDILEKISAILEKKMQVQGDH